MPNNKDTRWITLLIILIATVVAAAGLAIGFVSVRSIENRSPLDAPTTPTAIPATTTPIVSAADAQGPTPPTPPATSVPEPQLPTPTPLPFFEGPFAYGTSVGGLPLLAYRFGTGPSARAIIGGIHGGYEWNTVVLVSETLKYLQENPVLIPDNVTLYVIPCANPDGYAAGQDLDARANANGVDLNRNWDYQWQPTATHGTRPVNAGTHPFSEPETAALRDFIQEQNVEAAIFYHSAMARIFYGVERDHSATYELAVAVSEVTGYPTAAGVPGQITTGDAIDWMSAQGLAGIEVELSTHEDIEWERNFRGFDTFVNWTPSPARTQIVQTSQIGASVQERPIKVTQVGSGGQVALVIIGSIHGDEGNTEALVQDLMTQFVSTPEMVPPDFTLYFVPTMNPDGLTAGTRQNANLVDLNRNWPTDDWQADAARTAGIVPGSGGTAPGSEPEVQAVHRWLLETVKSAATQVWLLSYHSAYPPDGGVQPGYTVYGTPSAEADRLASLVVDLSGYAYLPNWPSEHPFTGELIHWCDLNGIWAVDVELPSHDAPDTVPSGLSETTLATHQRVLSGLLAGIALTGPLPDKDGIVRHVVEMGDTLSGIAYRYGVDVEEIRRLNNIEHEDHIVAGEELFIPVAVSDHP